MTGEFARIELFLRAFEDAGGRTRGGAVTLGPGDDCAIVEASRPLAVTTDVVVEGVHFRRDWATPAQVGHKALAVNLSDLAAMGARPVAFTCAIALPASFDDGELAGIARGLGALAARHGAVLAGGNFARAPQLSLTITAMGELDGEPLRRDRARAGDRVLLVGDVGVAGAELRALFAGHALAPGTSPLHEPEPLVREGLVAAKHARCGIDVSDGLVQDLGHVARASRVKLTLDLDRVPRSARFRELTRGASPAEAAALLLAGGEDYALVVTAPEAAATELERELAAVEIGSVGEGEGVVVERLPAGTRLAGHDHFAARG